MQCCHWVDGQRQPKLWEKPQEKLKKSKTQITSTTLVFLEQSHCTSEGLGQVFSAQLGGPVQPAEDAQLGWIQEQVFLTQAIQFMGKVYIKFQEKLQSVLIKIHRFFQPGTR